MTKVRIQIEKMTRCLIQIFCELNYDQVFGVHGCPLCQLKKKGLMVVSILAFFFFLINFHFGFCLWLVLLFFWWTTRSTLTCSLEKGIWRGKNPNRNNQCIVTFLCPFDLFKYLSEKWNWDQTDDEPQKTFSIFFYNTRLI